MSHLLTEIQSIENQLIYSDNCGAGSLLFTDMMHKTSEWINSDYKHKEVHISPYKKELDVLVDAIAYYIECGESTTNAIMMAGVCYQTVFPKFTDTHKHILRAARKVRQINITKNK